MEPAWEYGLLFSGKLVLKEFIVTFFPMPEPGAGKWQLEWLDLGAVENTLI